MPPQLKPFLSEADWRSLRLGSLDRDDRKDVLELVLAAFDGEDPAKVTRKDIYEVLRRTKSLADDLRRSSEDEPCVGRKDAILAEEAARAVIREDRARRKRK